MMKEKVEAKEKGTKKPTVLGGRHKARCDVVTFNRG